MASSLTGLGPLSLLQRVLLMSDGTVTDIVEAAFEEPVRLVKLRMETVPAAEPVAAPGIAAGAPLMRRQIMLQGASTGTTYVHAETLIALDALPPGFREELMETDAPIGRLWAQYQLETRKEMLRIWRTPGGDLARTYRVFSSGKPIMLITEQFPVASPS